MSSRLLLGIETSCDDTCAAVVAGDEIRSNVISSQAAAHARYGGVVPEVASRHHVELMTPVVDAALSEAGVDAQLHVFDGLGHCFYYDASAPEGADAYRTMVRFFRKHLGTG